jgi:hypothetical protein
MLKRNAIPIIGIALIAGGYIYWSQSAMTQQGGKYNPTINPSEFVGQVDNKYFTLKPGTKFTYNNKTRQGTERIEVLVTNETKTVMGVTTTVVRDRVWLNDQLIEDTRDWYAQDKAGNVWYFGETVDNYSKGKLKDHKGSWEAGVNGAKPGIIMLKDPKVGDKYRQEYYRGVAEDEGTVVALDKKVTVPYGSFEGCLQTRDSTRLESSKEDKYYCPAVGFVVLEQSVTSGGEKVELVGVTSE